MNQFPGRASTARPLCSSQKAERSTLKAESWKLEARRGSESEARGLRLEAWGLRLEPSQEVSSMHTARRRLQSSIGSDPRGLAPNSTPSSLCDGRKTREPALWFREPALQPLAHTTKLPKPQGQLSIIRLARCNSIHWSWWHWNSQPASQPTDQITGDWIPRLSLRLSGSLCVSVSLSVSVSVCVCLYPSVSVWLSFWRSFSRRQLNSWVTP